MTTQQPVISNTPKNDPRAAGIPKGHPPLTHFLGIPFFKRAGELCGMVGIANKPGGYSAQDIELLEPFTVTCSNLIQAFDQRRQNTDLINTLEEKVKARTRELETANDNLEEANRRVVKASRAQLEHFACMSHEIRTPLNCIIGLSSLLQDSELSPMQVDSVKMIVSSGELLLAVVNDVLDYSKLESGNVEIDIQRRNLQDTLNSVVHSVESKAQSKGISVLTQYDAAIPQFVKTDSHRLQQILYNLLGNAVKFSKDNGVVELRVELIPACPHQTGGGDQGRDGCPTNMHAASEEESDTRCPFHRPPSPREDSDNAVPSTSAVAKKTTGEYLLRYTVKDYGKGIAEEDFEKIFRPFSQANVETEALYGGTGLGLAITAKLVAALGGRTSVDSEEGKWSKFTVDMPFHGSHVNTKAIAGAMQNTVVILVGDDNTVDTDAAVSMCRLFDIGHAKYSNATALKEDLLKGALPRAKSYVYLTQEDLYDENLRILLSKTTPVAVATFGPEYSVRSTKCHFRSLLHMLPSVLAESLSAIVSDLKSPTNTIISSPPSPSGKGKECALSYRDIRVLIAEDNAINQKVLHRMLKRVGVEHVDIVDNGRKAVDKEAVTSYDMVFMDMQMPVLDGIGACRLITNRTGGHDKPLVVFVTAHVEQSFQTQCAAAGGSGFLPKPFHVRDIEECFQNLQLGRSIS